jgi:DNA repair exonuclease SbcCD ATPase subunit
MASTPVSPVKRLQRRIDELIVQLDLGKLEARARVEAQREQVQALLDRVARAIDPARLTLLRQQLEELRVQIQLGKLDTREALLHHKERLDAAVGDVLHALADSKAEVHEEFRDAAHALSDKLHLLALDAGAAVIVAGEQAAAAKDAVKAKLVTLTGTLQARAETAGEGAHRVAAECRQAFEDIRSNLRSLRG